MICHQLDEVVLRKRKIGMTEMTETVEIPYIKYYILTYFCLC